MASNVSTPYMPRLLMVNVPLLYSSGASCLPRARFTRSAQFLVGSTARTAQQWHAAALSHAHGRQLPMKHHTGQGRLLRCAAQCAGILTVNPTGSAPHKCCATNLCCSNHSCQIAVQQAVESWVFVLGRQQWRLRCRCYCSLDHCSGLLVTVARPARLTCSAGRYPLCQHP